ncbi:MAG: class I SAM-dependent methyltransferase [Methylacidiphilales bacterium]|nr:class I SAM-dependent methyltransferase [Candidatus Methylacidiphilales bacterium]
MSRLQAYIQIVKRSGFSGLLSWWRKKLFTRFYELWLGINSEQYYSSQALGYVQGKGKCECDEYSPIEYESLINALGKLNKYLDGGYQNSVWIDYGCGLGRAVFVAALFPFKRVIGVDLTAFLIEGAKANLAKARRRLKCQNVEFICEDATKYRVPTDVNVVFLNNPFHGSVFDGMMERLCESLREKDREIFMLFNCPTVSELEEQVKRRGDIEILDRWGDSCNAERLYFLGRLRFKSGCK